MRRRKLLVALAGLAVVVAAGVAALWPRPDQVTAENYDRIMLGMSRAEVEAILGPPGDGRTGPTDWGEERPAVVQVGQNGQCAQLNWQSDTLWATVTLDPTDQAVLLQGYRVKPVPLDAYRVLLWRAKRLWHRWFP